MTQTDDLFKWTEEFKMCSLFGCLDVKFNLQLFL